MKLEFQNKQSGFTLVELLVAAAIFAFLVIGIAQLFIDALNIQRRAAVIQKVQENGQFLIESIAREVRVAKINSVSAKELSLTLPSDEDPVVYSYSTDNVTGNGYVARNGKRITSEDVNFSDFRFIRSAGGSQPRITMPMTIKAKYDDKDIVVSLQTTVTSRAIDRSLFTK